MSASQQKIDNGRAAFLASRPRSLSEIKHVSDGNALELCISDEAKVKIIIYVELKMLHVLLVSTYIFLAILCFFFRILFILHNIHEIIQGLLVVINSNA